MTKRTLVERPYCSGTLTKSGLMGRIRSNIRFMSVKWRPRSDYLKSIRRPYTGPDKRKKWEYQCQHCWGWFPIGTKKNPQFQVNHIIPCGSLQDWGDIGSFYQRMLCEKEGFMGLCVPCHQVVTNEGRG